MLVTLFGVTGVGKSFFKKLIAQELGFKNLPIVTTREKRTGEINGIDKEFVTQEEFQKMKQAGITQIDFEFLGVRYAYRKEYLQSPENRVTEAELSNIYKLKKCVKDMFAIYLVPYDLERAKLELQKRNLPEEVYQKRLAEIHEHIKEYSSNPNLQKQFDCVLINDYTEISQKKLLEIVKQKMNTNKR